MREPEAGQETRTRGSAVDKHVPPPFVAQRDRHPGRVRWWKGLTPTGKLGLLAGIVLLAALVAGLAVGLAGPGSSTTARPPRREPTVVFSFSLGNAQMDMAALAAGLAFTLQEVSKTSMKLQKELDSTYGNPPGTSGGRHDGSAGAGHPGEEITASLEVLADGSDGGVPANSGKAVSKIASRYLERYRKYVQRVSAIRAAALEIPAGSQRSADARAALIKACDDLLRDASAIAAGLEMLGADPGQDGEIAQGISAANRRVISAEVRIDDLIKDLGKKNLYE